MLRLGGDYLLPRLHVGRNGLKAWSWTVRRLARRGIVPTSPRQCPHYGLRHVLGKQPRVLGWTHFPRHSSLDAMEASWGPEAGDEQHVGGWCLRLLLPLVLHVLRDRPGGRVRRALREAQPPPGGLSGGVQAAEQRAGNSAGPADFS